MKLTADQLHRLMAHSLNPDRAALEGPATENVHGALTELALERYCRINYPDFYLERPGSFEQ